MDSRTDEANLKASGGPKGRTWTRTRTALAWTGAIAAGLAVAVALFLAFFDWDALRGPIARYASGRMGREVRIEGRLRAHLLTWTPTVEVEGLSIGNPAWAGPGDTAHAQRLIVSVRLLSLLGLHPDLPLVELDQPRFDLIRDKDERENWALGSGRASKPMNLPPIQRFVIRDGQLSLKDAHRRLTLVGTVNAAEDDSHVGAGRQAFELVGRGTIDGAPFLLEAAGGPLIHVQRNKPYPYRLDVRAGATRIAADGRLNRPFDLGDTDGEVSAVGANLRDLYPLTGVLFPATPAYSLHAHFNRQGTRFDLTDASGMVGDTDLEGRLIVDKPGGRRQVTADLTSRRLVFADLLAVIGGGPKAGVVKTTAAAPPPTPAGRLLPDARLRTAELKTLDAKVVYRAQSVATGKWPLKRFVLNLALDGGVLTMDPIDFEFPQGRLAGKLKVDARGARPVSDLDMRLSNVALQQFFKPSAGGRPPLEGTLLARARLHGVGDTMHEAASNADGRVVMAVPHGRMRQAFAELLGINLANGLYLLLSKDPKETDLRCAVASFDVRNGVMSVKDAVFDTGVVRADGKGQVDLKSETLDLRLDGKPKKPRFIRAWSPITLKGSLLHPRPGVDAGSVAAQTGLSAAVGALLAPLAAILPFIEPGLAKDADCAALIAEAETKGAPVKAVSGGPPAHAPG